VIRQVSVVTKNQPGELNAICEALGGAGINIDSLVAEGWGSTGVIKLITTDPESAKKVIEQRGYPSQVSDVFTLKIPDKPGELAKVTKKLRDAGINIDGLYLLNKIDKKTEIALAVDRVPEAKKVLGL
jgi:hypothetical protein